MRLLKFECENFLSYQKASFPVKPGLWLISAVNLSSDCMRSNGSGKSALVVDLPVWTLYGKTAREQQFGVKAVEWSKDDVVNLKAKKNCRGSVTMEIDGMEYVVNRYRKHTDYGNHVHLINATTGANLTGETDAETDAKIEKLVGMSYTAYCNSVIFGQGPVKRFSQCSDAERRRIFESFFDLSVFNDARKLVKEDKDSLDTYLVSLRQQLSNLSGRLAVYESNVQNAASALAAFNKNSSEEANKKEIVKLTKACSEAKATLESQQTALKDSEKQLQAAKKELSTYDLDSMRSNMKESIENVRLLERKSDILSSKVYEWKKQLDQFHESHKQTCPTCLRVMNADDVKAFKSQITASIKKAEGDKKIIEAQVDPPEMAMRDMESKIAEAEVLSITINDLNLRYNRQQTRVAEAQSNLRDKQQQLERAEAVEKGRTEESKRLTDAVSSAKKILTDATVEVQNCNQKIKKSEEIQKDILIWLDGFGNYGIKNDCYTDGIAFVNLRLAYFLQCMTGGEVTAHFDVSGEEVKLVMNVVNAANKYTLSSGGQAKRLDFCIALALQSVVEVGVQKVNMSVFDEFGDSLDDLGRGALMEFMKNEVTNKGTVYAISHSQEVEDYFDGNIIHIAYENGVSHIV